MDDSEQILTALAGILVLGIGSQWIAGRLKVPSILLLLAAGILAGPVTGFIVPEKLLGNLVLPIVSLSVGVILFEGAMSLRIAELREIGRPLFLLLTVGVVITGVCCGLGAYYILEFNVTLSMLLGAILTVTGPTVVGPMLRHIRPIGRVGTLARWEGIVVDPVGAILAVLVFAGSRSTITAGMDDAAVQGALGFLLTFVVGTCVGTVAAIALRELLRRHWIDDHLQSPVTLMLVIVAFAVSNRLLHESGLVAVTVMGLIMANQQVVAVRHIVEFKENLSVLLISSLFILLAARLDLGRFAEFGWRGPAFVAFVILLVRPVSVLISTIGCGLPIRERLFLSWLAPRGIVAAAVASVFALQFEEGDQFVAATFMIIVGTVVVYGLTAGWVARRLGLSIDNPQGVLIVSAHAGARAIGHALSKLNIRVLLVDTEPQHVGTARMEGLPTFLGNVLSEALHEANLGGLGRLISMTANDEVNLLAAERGAELFGRKASYRLSVGDAPIAGQDHSVDVLAGRVLFSDDATYTELDRRFSRGDVIKATKITEEFGVDQFHEQYSDALVMFLLDATGKLTICSTDTKCAPEPGQTIIALVQSQSETTDAASSN